MRMIKHVGMIGIGHFEVMVILCSLINIDSEEDICQTRQNAGLKSNYIDKDGFGALLLTFA